MVFGMAYAQNTKAPRPPGTAKATFAGGCFWCMEGPFDKVPGVISTTSGYTGGKTKNPTYEQVSSGTTGHAESVEVQYDPTKVSYEKLLDVFWHNIDPTQRDGQFCDHGSQYRTAIFYHSDEQRKLAEASKAALQKNKPFKGDIVTEIVPAQQFYPAEEYHQDFYKKNPVRYKIYRTGCGRDARLQALWGRSGE
jgi:peptide-methionine (S)-S-oxide reductase